MKKYFNILLNLFCSSCLILVLLILVQTTSFSQNVLDQLKSATDQLQKGIDQNSNKKNNSVPASNSTSQTTTPAPKTTTSNTSTAPKAIVAPEGNFSLFGLKLGDSISNAKLDNKGFEKEKYFIFSSGVTIAALIPKGHSVFTPQTKNEIFDMYLISYGPITRKIEGIYGRTKTVFKTAQECRDGTDSAFKFVYEKLIKDNPNFRAQPDSSSTYSTIADLIFFNESVVLHQSCKNNDNGWLILSFFKVKGKNMNGEDAIVPDSFKIQQEINQLKAQEKDKQFEKEKDSGKMKGL
jgi:hypothetical protein